MPSSTSSKDVKMPDFDPYQVLGIPFGASDADITKAYRKLALQLHPDKQQSLSAQEQEQVAHKFHRVQEARSFLLDADHAQSRRAYDTKRASQQLRKEQDAKREQSMSERRKRMREELRRKEQASTEKERKKEDLVNKLRKEGSSLRKDYSERAAQEQMRKKSKQEKAERREKEERQVRLKWSRSRMQTSPSEHSLAQLMSKFGPVESVELIGSKGNAALITFQNVSSCLPCVEAYATSEEMRMTLVGKRKQEYEEKQQSKGKEPSPPRQIPTRATDREGLEERKYRQAAEREKLMRQMEMEDEGHVVPEEPSTQKAKPPRTRPFPLEFANTDPTLSPLQKLEQFEKDVFGDVLSSERIQRMQVAP